MGKEDAVELGPSSAVAAASVPIGVPEPRHKERKKTRSKKSKKKKSKHAKKEVESSDDIKAELLQFLGLQRSNTEKTTSSESSTEIVANLSPKQAFVSPVYQVRTTSYGDEPLMQQQRSKKIQRASGGGTTIKKNGSFAEDPSKAIPEESPSPVSSDQESQGGTSAQSRNPSPSCEDETAELPLSPGTMPAEQRRQSNINIWKRMLIDSDSSLSPSSTNAEEKNLMAMIAERDQNLGIRKIDTDSGSVESTTDEESVGAAVTDPMDARVDRDRHLGNPPMTEADIWAERARHLGLSPPSQTAASSDVGSLSSSSVSVDRHEKEGKSLPQLGESGTSSRWGSLARVMSGWGRSNQHPAVPDINDVKDTREPGTQETESGSVKSSGSGSENTRDEVYEDGSMSHVSHKTVPRSTVYPDSDCKLELDALEKEVLSVANDAKIHDGSSSLLTAESSVHPQNPDGATDECASDQLSELLRTDDEHGTALSNENVSVEPKDDDSASTKSHDSSFNALFDQECDSGDEYHTDHHTATELPPSSADDCVSVADHGNASLNSNASSNASVMSYRSHYFSESSADSYDANSDDGGSLSHGDLAHKTATLDVPAGSPVETASNEDENEKESGFNLRSLWDMLSLSDHSASTSSSDSRLGVLRLRTRPSTTAEEASTSTTIGEDEGSVSDHTSGRQRTIYKDEEVQRLQQQQLSPSLSGYSTPSEVDEDEISDTWSEPSAVEYEQCEEGMALDNHGSLQQQPDISPESTYEAMQDMEDVSSAAEESSTSSFQNQQGRCLPPMRGTGSRRQARQETSHNAKGDGQDGGLLSDSTLAIFAWSLLFCGLVMLGICAIIFVSLEYTGDGDSNDIDSSSLTDDLWPGTDTISADGTHGDIFVASDSSP